MVSFFFFNDTATTEIYTLSLHDALPISYFRFGDGAGGLRRCDFRLGDDRSRPPALAGLRSEEHTSELQSRQYLVCRLLLEKKKEKHTRKDIEFTNKKRNRNCYFCLPKHD